MSLTSTGRSRPSDDIETVNTELVLADLQTLDKAIPRLEKESRLHKDRRALLEAAQEAREILDSGRTLFSAGVDAEMLRELRPADDEALPLRLQRRRG